MLMEPIILVFIKVMGAAISGHWDLRDTGTTRVYDTLAPSLGYNSIAVTVNRQQKIKIFKLRKHEKGLEKN